MNKEYLQYIDKALEYDCTHNETGMGYLSPRRLFEEVGVPEEAHGWLLREIMAAGLFEYNKPQIGIRTTLLGKEVYEKGGYRRYVRKENRKRKWLAAWGVIKMLLRLD